MNRTALACLALLAHATPALASKKAEATKEAAKPAAAAPAADPVKAMEGHWVSPAPENIGNGAFATRDFVFKDGRWLLTFTIVGDAEGKFPLLAFIAEGPWKVTGPSKVEGAHEASFEFATKKLELKAADPKVAQQLGVAACGLEVGKAKDVSKDGCGMFGSVAAYGREFDLVALKDGKAFLGARPADGNMGSADKRPTALGAPLSRAK